MALSDRVKQQILDNKDMPARVIAEMFGIGVNTVYYILRNAGITKAKTYVKRAPVFKEGVPVSISWEGFACVIAIRREDAQQISIRFR